MDPNALNRAFEEIVQDLGVPTPGISAMNLNQTIWRLSEAAMYLSRHIQYAILDPEHEFPDGALTILPNLAVMASELSRLLQNGEPGCLECLEAESFGDYDDDEE